MNLDDQLILGIVFIIAGVAMGLLAYAAFLNRREKSGEEEPGADEAEAEPLPEGETLAPESTSPDAATELSAEQEQGADEAAAEPVPEGETLATESASSDVAEESSAEEETVQPDVPTATGEAHEPPGPGSIQASTPPDQEPPEVSPAQPSPSTAETQQATGAQIGSETDPAAQPSALLRRDPDSGRLLVEIGDRRYRSIEELQDSADWQQVNDLFSDILAWLVKQEPKPEELGLAEEDSSPDKPLSMIQQINEIIKEKLAEREGGPKAVRLMEATDGSVRVYIGVDSYEMDEVPDEEAQAIIQQAVREWESRQ